MRDASMLEQLRDASVRDLRAFITERGFSYAGLLENPTRIQQGLHKVSLFCQTL